MQARTRGSLVGESTGFTVEAAPRAGGAGTTSGGQVNPADVPRRRFASGLPPSAGELVAQDQDLGGLPGLPHAGTAAATRLVA
jgi:hypothetical protein